ncbi:MAG: hypothetical protein E7K12_20470, partial [Citrobacter sp.]
GHLKIGVSVRHIFKPISYLEIQLLSGVSGGYITLYVASECAALPVYLHYLKIAEPYTTTPLNVYRWKFVGFLLLYEHHLWIINVFLLFYGYWMRC